jgi:hypothetical protein
MDSLFPPFFNNLKNQLMQVGKAVFRDLISLVSPMQGFKLGQQATFSGVQFGPNGNGNVQ